MMRAQTIMRNIFIFICMSAVALLFTSGCTKKDQGEVSKEKKDQSPVVASVGHSAITAADLKAYLARRPVPPRFKGAKDEVQKRLDEMVLEEVLYHEAIRLKLDQEPEVRRNIRQILTQKLMSKQMNQKELWNKKIAESELQDYYTKHWDQFNRPAQVRLADIFISVPSDATDKKKAELKKKAEMVLTEALKLREKRMGFGTLVRKYSDTPKKYRKGDTGFFDKEGKPVGIDKALIEAAFKLERPGRMSEQVIETSDGYHLVMLTGKRSAINWPLEKVRHQITQRIRREKLKDQRESYIEGLKTKADISIDDKVLAEVAAQAVKPKPRPPVMPGHVKPLAPKSPQRPPGFPGKE